MSRQPPLLLNVFNNKLLYKHRNKIVNFLENYIYCFVSRMSNHTFNPEY